MKKSFILAGLLVVGYASAQEGNVGINTSTPQATLDITANTADGDKVEGLMIPRITYAKMQAMKANLTEKHDGLMVYVTDYVEGGNSKDGVYRPSSYSPYFVYNGVAGEFLPFSPSGLTEVKNATGGGNSYVLANKALFHKTSQTPTELGQGAIDLSTDETSTLNAQGDYSFAAQGGYAGGEYSTAIGQGTIANGSRSMALLGKAQANGTGSFAVQGGRADGEYATAMGPNASASAISAAALGYYATASGPYAIALGNSARSTGNSSSAIGPGAKASGRSSFAAQGGTASADHTIAIGQLATASVVDALAIGQSAQASAFSAIAMGLSAKASSTYAIALGQKAQASAGSTVAVGSNAIASASNATALGADATASASNAIAFGVGTTAVGQYATALGYEANARGYESFAAHGGITTNTREFAFGENFNTDTDVETDISTTLSPTRQIFSVGRGTGIKQNALIILRNAYTGIGLNSSVPNPASSKPTEMLDVNGNIRVRGTVGAGIITAGGACTNLGTITFSGDNFYGCKSTGWVRLNN